MSSLGLSDGINSSEDEDQIIAAMETNSGLPQKGQGHHHRNDGTVKTMETDSSVASVKMMGRAMKSVTELYDSSESEGETIMQSLQEQISEKNDSCIVNGNDDSLHEDQLSDSVSNRSKNDKTFKSSSVHSPDSRMKHSKSEAVLGWRSSATRTGSFESESKMNSRRCSENETRYKSNRFNPFDRDLHVDENHFDEQNSGFKPKGPAGRLKSGKTRPLGYNFFFIPNSAEHEIYSAHKC